MKLPVKEEGRERNTAVLRPRNTGLNAASTKLQKIIITTKKTFLDSNTREQFVVAAHAQLLFSKVPTLNRQQTSFRFCQQ